MSRREAGAVPTATGATLPARLRQHARTRARDVALREKAFGVWREGSWADYLTEVAAVAHQLAALGVGRGDSVAVLSDNRPEWLYADLGAQCLGARSVGVYQTSPAEDVAWILAHSGARVLVCEDQEQVDKAVAVRAETPALEHVIVIDPRGTRSYSDKRLRPWDAFLEAGRAAHAADPGWIDQRIDALAPEAPSMVVYTSGTTGHPKGALLSSASALSMADACVEVLSVGPEELILSYLPLCHVAEKIFSLFLPLTVGCVVHFGESIETVRSDLREVSPTVFLGVPRIWEKIHASVSLKMRDSSWLKRRLYERCSRRGSAIAGRRRRGALTLLDRVEWWLADLLVFRALQERLGLRRCRLPVAGAAPISADLLGWLWGIGVPVLEGYGQTECAGVSNLNPPGAPRLGTVGQALSGTEVRLAEDGEIPVRGPGVFTGYLDDEEATRATLDPEGWLATGDVGGIDADGYLSITGRKKEIIITAGGKNLSPEKIENAMKLSPYIKEAVAIGDARRFVGALVMIDRDAVGDWADRQELAYTSYGDLASKPDVIRLITEAVDEANGHLARVEQVRSFRLLPRELNQDDGELTATQKVRRRSVLEAWGELVETMYGPGGSP